MLSRVANSVYWMNRYLERADNVARFIDVNLHLMMEMGFDRDQAQWLPLVQASGDDKDFSKRYDEASEKNVIRFLTFDTDNPNSIISCIQSARENARTLREIIPVEQWETINQLHHYIQGFRRRSSIQDLQEFYTEIQKASTIYTGLMTELMPHDEAWHFAVMGKLLERADKTARLLDVKYFSLLPYGEGVDSTYDAIEWGAVLRSANGSQMYRRQFHRVNYKDVTQFLIFDSFFPRSMMYCVSKALNSFQGIIEYLRLEPALVEEFEILAGMLASHDVNAVVNQGIHEFIDEFQKLLNIVDNHIYETFFAHESESGE